MAPVRVGRSSTFRRYDWSRRELGVPEPLPDADVFIVDLIGLFHPEALSSIDLAIWCDVELETATVRGMTRDAELGRNHVDLWRDVWVPNELDFENVFAPRSQADVVYNPSC